MIFQSHLLFLLQKSMNNEYFMTLAIKEAINSEKDLPIGAILVMDNKIIASASNTKILSQDR